MLIYLTPFVSYTVRIQLLNILLSFLFLSFRRIPPLTRFSRWNFRPTNSSLMTTYRGWKLVPRHGRIRTDWNKCKGISNCSEALAPPRVRYSSDGRAFDRTSGKLEPLASVRMKNAHLHPVTNSITLVPSRNTVSLIEYSFARIPSISVKREPYWKLKENQEIASSV